MLFYSVLKLQYAGIASNNIIIILALKTVMRLQFYNDVKLIFANNKIYGINIYLYSIIIIFLHYNTTNYV